MDVSSRATRFVICLRLCAVLVASVLLLLLPSAVAQDHDTKELNAAPQADGDDLHLACSAMVTTLVAESKGVASNTVFNNVVSILDNHDLNLSISFMPRPRGILKSAQGAVDGLCVCSSDESLDEIFHYSKAFGSVAIGVITKKTNPLVVEEQDEDITKALMGKRVGVVSRDSLDKYLSDVGFKDFVTLDSPPQAFNMMELDRVDALIVRHSLVYPIDGAHFSKKYFFQEIHRSSLHFCFAGEKGEKLISKINRNM